MAEKFANDVATTLSESITSSATTLKVVSTTGFPPTGSFRLRIDNEILLDITEGSGTTRTVTRAVEAVAGVTAAASHLSAAVVSLVISAGSLAAGIAEQVTSETAALDTDATMAANSDTRVASQKATKTLATVLTTAEEARAKGAELAASSSFEPQLAGVMSPVQMPAGFYIGNSFVPGEKVPNWARVIVPKAGTLKDLICWPKTSAGNVAMAVYDTGDAESGKRTLLYQSGSVAVGTASKWQVVAESPGLTVKAGQQLDLFVVFDSATVELGRWALTSAGAASLPANFNKVTGGASPKFSGVIAAISAITSFPATITEALMLTNSNIPAIGCRVE